MAPIRKFLVAPGLIGENSQEKIVYKRKWLLGVYQVTNLSGGRGLISYGSVGI
jgi:hypothetical protein